MIIGARVITDIQGSRSISWDFVLSVGSMGGLLFFVMLIHCGWKRQYGQSILLVKYRLLANDLTWEASDAQGPNYMLKGMLWEDSQFINQRWKEY